MIGYMVAVKWAGELNFFDMRLFDNVQTAWEYHAKLVAREELSNAPSIVLIMRLSNNAEPVRIDKD